MECWSGGVLDCWGDGSGLGGAALGCPTYWHCSTLRFPSFHDSDTPPLHISAISLHFLSGVRAGFSAPLFAGVSAEDSAGALAPWRYSRVASCFNFLRNSGSILSWTSNRASCSLRSSFTFASSSFFAAVRSYNLMI